jgi:hypothetical protein
MSVGLIELVVLISELLELVLGVLDVFARCFDDRRIFGALSEDSCLVFLDLCLRWLDQLIPFLDLILLLSAVFIGADSEDLGIIEQRSWMI